MENLYNNDYVFALAYGFDYGMCVGHINTKQIKKICVSLIKDIINDTIPDEYTKDLVTEKYVAEFKERTNYRMFDNTSIITRWSEIILTFMWKYRDNLSEHYYNIMLKNIRRSHNITKDEPFVRVHNYRNIKRHISSYEDLSDNEKKLIFLCSIHPSPSYDYDDREYVDKILKIVGVCKKL